MNKDEQDIIENQLKEFGIKPAPKDDPICRGRSSVSFVPPSQRNIENAPGQSPKAEPQTIRQIACPSSNIPRFRITEPSQLYVHFVVALLKNGDIPGIRSMLTQAANEGLDWQIIYASAVRMRPASWPPAPRLRDVAPVPTSPKAPQPNEPTKED